MVSYFIPYRPVSVNTFYRTTRQGRIYICRTGAEFKQNIADYVLKTYKPVVIEKPVNVTIKLHFKDRRRMDIDNYLKPLIDSFNGILWKDDYLIYELHVFKSVLGIQNAIEIDITQKPEIILFPIQRPNQVQYQQYHDCECGATFLKKNLSRHLKGKLHIQWEEDQLKMG